MVWCLAAVFAVASCNDNSVEDVLDEEFDVNDFTEFVDENPENGASLGSIDASFDGGDLSFSLSDQSPSGAIAVNENTGEVTVADGSLFVFAVSPEITGTVVVDNGTETKNAAITILVNNPTGPTFNIWTGPKLTFTKQNGADPTNESNQDRITDNVWITRGNSGGQIFNIRVESSSSKTNSPTGTEWAVGTTADIESLTFDTFRRTVRPQNVVGQQLVLHLIEDDIYLDIEFKSWSSGRQGGFSYERATSN